MAIPPARVMTDNNVLHERRLRIVVVGGRSRSAQAFRRHASALAKFDMTILARQPVAHLAGEEVVVVSDYFSPPNDVLSRADVIVNFVGVPVNANWALLSALNIEGPARLFKGARANNVRQFVHLSSLHVYGDAESVHRTTVERPLSSYARSKLAGDQALLKEAGGGPALAIVRMPMHYGSGTGEKLRKLAVLIVKLGWFPAPRRRIARSVIHLDNLSVGITHIIEHRLGGICFVADPEPLSLEALVEVASARRGRTVRLIRTPELVFWPLKVFAKNIYRRLYRDNVISPDALLKLKYPVALKDGLRDVFP